MPATSGPDRPVIVHVVLGFALVSGCGGGPPPLLAPTDPPQLIGLSFPASYLAKRVSQPRAKVETLLPVGEDAPFWQPDEAAVARLIEADLIVANGAGYEAWTATASLPAAKLIDTSVGLTTIRIEGPTHSHGESGAHSHQGVDPHVWVDPALYTVQARNVHAALVQADPEGAVIYDANLRALEGQLSEIGTALDAALIPAKGRPMFANHPSFTYLARRASLELPTVDLDPSAPPSPELIATLTTQYPNGATVWWEADPASSVKSSFPTNFTHLVLDPLEQPDGAAYDYIAQSRVNIERLKRAFASAEPPTAPGNGEPAPAPGAPAAGAPTEGAPPAP